jgi:RNA polymerase sigma-70 factor (ECF subfamily)
VKTISVLIAENLNHAKNLVRGFRRSREWQEDIVQDACIKAIQAFNTCKDPSKFKSWFGTIVYNTALNDIREKKDQATGQDFDKFESPDTQQDQSIYDDYLNKKMLFVINKLSEKQKQAFIARYFHEQSFSSIAEEMKCPYNTAKANYRHALIKIKAFLDRGDLD